MKNASNPYNAMAGFYRTAVAVSALILSSSFAYAADPPVPRSNVSVNVNPTTGYYSTSNTTLRLPDGVSAAPASGASTVTKYSGGLKQAIPTGITIDAIKKTAPLEVAVRAKTPALKNAAKVVLRGNLAGLALGAGLNALLDSIDALIDDNGYLVKESSPSNWPIVSCSQSSSSCRTERGFQGGCSNAQCSNAMASAGLYPIFIYTPNGVGSCSSEFGCAATFATTSTNGWPLAGLTTNDWGARGVYTFGLPTPPTENTPISPSEINNAVDNSYNPEPSDWPNLTPHLNLDDVEITSAPTLQGEPKTTTVYDADGNPYEITETNIWYDFDIRDNPSSSPSLDLKMREETKTYKNGALTGTTTTETTEPAVVGGVAGGGGQAPTVEIPTDCDFHPTLCKWLEWTKEEPEEPEDNLSALLKEVPISSKTFTISGGAAACPAPLVLNLSQFGSREVSYQPLCDLASTMKFLYLALMSFAAAVLLHRSINRV